MTTLTGRTRFRSHCTDDSVLLVLQVEVLVRHVLPGKTGIFTVTDWRDATVEDLCEVNHLTYSKIEVANTIQLPEVDAVPGEAPRRGKSN